MTGGHIGPSSMMEVIIGRLRRFSEAAATAGGGLPGQHGSVQGSGKGSPCALVGRAGFLATVMIEGKSGR